MTNSAGPDQLAFSATDLGLHCLLRQGMSCSAREGLTTIVVCQCILHFLTIFVSRQ